MSQDLQAALRQRGMRVTPQRVVVHRALRELDRHVTADELLDAVTDPRTDPHHHLVCTVCGSVEDFEAAFDTAALERAAAGAGFRHERIEALVHGRCRNCA